MRSSTQDAAQLRRWIADEEQRQIKDAERAYQEALDRVILQNS